MNELWKYIILVLVAGFLSLFLSIYTHIKAKESPGARYFVIMTFLSSIFAFSYALELTAPTFKSSLFWLKIEYIPMPFIPAFILLMCIDYVGYKGKYWFKLILLIIPLITIFMVATNERHHLYHKSITLREDIPFPILQIESGPFFYLHAIYLFLCIMFGVILLLLHMKKVVPGFRKPIIMMILGLTIPIAANYFYINGLSPYGIDLGPISMSIGFVFCGASLIHFQIFNVIPIARDSVFEQIKDGVIVLNPYQVVVDFNKAMEQIFTGFSAQSVGKSIDDLLKENQTLISIFTKEQDSDVQITNAGQINHYHIQFSPIIKNSNTVGKIVTFTNITERVDLQNRLTHLASMDGLTNVYNRTFFFSHASETISSMNKKDEFCILMFDIDHFKHINDSYGHEAGDTVLIEIVKVVKSSLRSTDVIGRYGGEEFILFLPHTNLEDARKLANHVRLNIAESNIQIENEFITVTSSFGLAHSNVHENTKYILKKLTKEADQALYYAKNAGRNNVQLYSFAEEMLLK